MQHWLSSIAAEKHPEGALMRNSIFGTLFVICAVQSSAAAAQNLFEYRFDKLSIRSDLAACESSLQSIAAKFTEQSGITPFSMGCRENEIDHSQLDGIISYFAGTRVSTVTSRDLRSIDSQGAFPSMEACEAALPGRVEQFQSVYATEPMAAWCFHEYLYSPVFAARIDAIGTSDIKSLSVGFDFYGQPTVEQETILANLKSAAELKFPGHVVDTTMESKVTSMRTTLRSYSATRYYLDNMADMTFKTRAACEEALGDVDGIFDSLSEKPALLFCTVDGLSGIRVNLVTFTKDIFGPDLYRHYQAPQIFANRDECRTHAASVGNGNGAVVGTICTDKIPSVLHIVLIPIAAHIF